MVETADTEPLTSPRSRVMDAVAAKRLTWLAGVFAVVLLLYAFIIVEVYPQHRMRLPSVVVGILTCVATMVPLRRGLGARAMWTFSCGAFAYIATAMVTGGGISAPITIAIPIAVVLPGWLLGRRAARSFASATAVLCCAILIAELNGWLPTPPELPTPLRFIVVAGALGAAFAMTEFAARAHQRHMRQTAQLTAELVSAHADTALRMREFQALANNLPGLVMRFDPEGRCLFANQRFVLAAGGHQDALIGQPLEVVFNVRDANMLHAALRRARQHDRASVLLPDFRDPKGESLLEFMIEAEHDAHGKPLGFLALAYDVTSRERAQADLRRAVGNDPLTGVCNAVMVDDRLAHALERAGRDGHGLTVFSIDIDGFAAVNEKYGAVVGDAVLTHVAHQLRGALPIGDSIARLDADEFCVIAERIDTAEAAVKLGERLLAAVREPCHFDDRVISIGASVGVALYPQHGIRPDELRKIASTSMFSAKREGGHRVHVALGDYA